MIVQPFIQRPKKILNNTLKKKEATIHSFIHLWNDYYCKDGKTNLDFKEKRN